MLLARPPLCGRYAHLAQDERIASSDTLLDVVFAGPGVAFAFLKIGFPPKLYTDVLSLMAVRPDVGAEPRRSCGQRLPTSGHTSEGRGSSAGGKHTLLLLNATSVYHGVLRLDDRC